MIGRNKLVAVWLGANPGEKLLTICNCCLWKILPVINPSIGDKVTKMPVDEVMVTDKCGGCGTCMEGVCFVDAISLKEGIRVQIDEACRGCGRCVEVCPNQAIELCVDDQTFLSQTIDRLTTVVDIS